MASAEKINHLKLLIGAVDVTLPREAWPAPALPDGLPKGALVELIGPQKYEWFITFLKENSGLECFWTEKEQSVLPTALKQRGVDLNKISFAILGDEPYAPLRRIIQSGVYQVVLTNTLFTDIKTLKAFQLLTEKTGTTLILIGAQQASSAWPISLQLSISQSFDTAEFEIEVLKKRYGKLE